MSVFLMLYFLILTFLCQKLYKKNITILNLKALKFYIFTMANVISTVGGKI